LGFVLIVAMKEHLAVIHARMAMNTWAVFVWRTQEDAGIAGDVAMLESEVTDSARNLPALLG
jgi:hypothetical protein